MDLCVVVWLFILVPFPICVWFLCIGLWKREWLLHAKICSSHARKVEVFCMISWKEMCHYMHKRITTLLNPTISVSFFFFLWWLYRALLRCLHSFLVITSTQKKFIILPLNSSRLCVKNFKGNHKVQYEFRSNKIHASSHDMTFMEYS